MNNKIHTKNIKGALLYQSLLISSVAIMIVISVPAYFVNEAACIRIFDINYAYILLIVMTYVLPLVFLIRCAYAVHTGFNIYRYKVIPPKFIPIIKDTEVKTAKHPLGVFILSILFFTLSVYMLYVGNNAYDKITKDTNINTVLTHFNESCQVSKK